MKVDLKNWMFKDRNKNIVEVMKGESARSGESPN